MAGAKTHISNFSHLAVHDEQLAKLGALAEHYFSQDPNTCLLKLRQFGGLRQGSAYRATSNKRSTNCTSGW